MARSLRQRRAVDGFEWVDPKSGEARSVAMRGLITVNNSSAYLAACLAGLGIMVLPRSRVPQTALAVWEDAPLPELPQLYCGIYLRDGGNRPALEELADEIAAVLRPQLQVPEDRPASVAARASG